MINISFQRIRPDFLESTNKQIKSHYKKKRTKIRKVIKMTTDDNITTTKDSPRRNEYKCLCVY
jgi:hypothetical protein